MAVHSQQSLGDSPPHHGAQNTTLNIHGQAPHHRTVHIHSESNLKGSGFTQHQTRDVTMSLESGDSATPSQLQAQLLLLQDSLTAGEAEKAGLLEQVRYVKHTTFSMSLLQLTKIYDFHDSCIVGSLSPRNERV